MVENTESELERIPFFLRKEEEWKNVMLILKLSSLLHIHRKRLKFSHCRDTHGGGRVCEEVFPTSPVFPKKSIHADISGKSRNIMFPEASAVLTGYGTSY